MHNVYLIIVIMAMEEWLLFEYHASKHTSQTPQI